MKAFKFIPLSVMLLNVAHAELITADDSSDSMSDCRVALSEAFKR